MESAAILERVAPEKKRARSVVTQYSGRIEGAQYTARCIGPLTVSNLTLSGHARVRTLNPAVYFRPPGTLGGKEVWEGRPHRCETWTYGKLYFLPAGSEVATVSDVWREGVNIQFNGGAFEKAAAELIPARAQSLEFVEVNDPVAYHLARSMGDMAKALDVAEWPEMVEAGSLALTASVLRSISLQGQPAPPHAEVSRLGPLRRKRVMSYVAANLARRISLAELAAVAGLSQYHFSRLFTAAVGLSPLRYVMRERVELAKRALIKPDANLAAIAYECGFGGQSHFTTTFKQFTGVTPGEYRRAQGVIVLAA